MAYRMWDRVVVTREGVERPGEVIMEPVPATSRWYIVRFEDSRAQLVEDGDMRLAEEVEVEL